jgi:hypothetical protein
MYYELQAIYDTRASFYGKARVHRHSNVKELVSYTTHVATIVDDKAYVFGTYSQTTLRHIKEFLLQNGFEAINSKQILKEYGTEKAGVPA